MNINIYKNISQLSFYMLQSNLNQRIVFPLGLNIKRNIRQVPRPREGSIATQTKETLILNSNTPDLTITKTTTERPQDALLPPSSIPPKEKTKKPQYPSPTPALLPSEKKKQNLLQLTENILLSSDVKTVFNIYFENQNNFELDQYISTLQRLSELFKQSHSSVSIQELHESKEFQSLCYNIWKQISQMDVRFVLRTYKSLSDLKVKTKSLIMQALLQMARHQINMYSIEQLIYLNILLTKETENCHLKDALELAIPKVIENSIAAHFPSHLNFNKMNKLLHLCITKEIKGLNDVLHFIHKSSLPLLLSQDMESPRLNNDVLSLLSNLLSLDYRKNDLNRDDLDIANNLIVTCLDCLVERKLEGLNKTGIIAVLRKLGRCYSSGFDLIYNEEFLSMVVEKSLNENWDMKSLFDTVTNQVSMNYVNDELLSVVASNIKEIHSQVLDFQLLQLILAMASSDIPKETFKETVDFIMKNLNLEESLNNMKIPWIRLLLNLLSMDYIDSRFMKSILNEDFLKRYLEYRENATREFLDLLRVQKYLKVLKNSSDFEVPSQVLPMTQEFFNHPLPVLGKFLESIIGNSRCIISDVVTPQNNHIDHVIVLNQDGKPVEMTQEEILKSNDSSSLRKFAIIEVPASLTMRPGYKLRSYFKLEQRLIEAEGFIFVPIYQLEIESLHEASKLGIKNKLKELGFTL